MRAARFGVALAAGLFACHGAEVRPDRQATSPTLGGAPAATRGTPAATHGTAVGEARVASNAAGATTPGAPGSGAKAGAGASLKAPPKEKDAQELLAEAKADFAKGRYAEAKEAFAKLGEKRPDDAALQFDLGLVAEKLGDVAGAQKAYQAAHRLAPAEVPAALNLARLYRVSERLDDAIAVYQEALAAKENGFNAKLLDSLSAALREKKDYAKAEAAAKKSLSRNKDDVEAYKSLALISFDQGNYRLAELLCANAKKVAPKDPGIFNDLGLIYLKQGEVPLALAQFQKAIELDPRFEPGYANLGAIALRYRDYQGAERAFSQAVTLAPNRAQLHLDLAYALDGQRPTNATKGIAAAAEFEKVLALEPTSSEAICGAGWAYTADKTGFGKAEGYLARCRALPATGEAERSRIDAKLQALAVLAPKTPADKPADAKGLGGGGHAGEVAPIGVTPIAPKQTPTPSAATQGTGASGASPASSEGTGGPAQPGSVPSATSGQGTPQTASPTQATSVDGPRKQPQAATNRPADNTAAGVIPAQPGDAGGGQTRRSP